MSDLLKLRRAAAQCTACELYTEATQTVFGSGHPDAAMVLVGEQPGDREDIAGEPFVRPAGRVLEAALERAGVARADVYVTNVVKHFRFRRQGKVRIHRTPGVEHVRACPMSSSERRLPEEQLREEIGEHGSVGHAGRCRSHAARHGRYRAEKAPLVNSDAGGRRPSMPDEASG